MSKKVLITATVQSHICQFHKPLVKMLHENGYEVHAAARDNLAEKNGLKLDFADKVYNVPFSRSPVSKNNIKAYKVIKEIIAENDYDIIHCNTPMGGVVTRLAAKKQRKNGIKVIYTAHGFHFYKGAPLKNWLFYYPVEWLFSWFTDCIITINTEDYNRAKKHLHAKNSAYIHGVGVSKERYNTLPLNEDFKNNLGYADDDFIVLCTGELNKNKNQSELIRAIAKLNNPQIKAIFAGNGPEAENLKALANELNVSDRVNFVGYRTDLEKFVKISDIVVSMSVREGLGLNIIEAMMCKKPIVAAENRGHKDLVQDGKGGFLVGAHDSGALAEKIEYLNKNKTVRQEFGEFNLDKAKLFECSRVKEELCNIYKRYVIK